jgi:hypothetical protein
MSAGVAASHHLWGEPDNVLWSTSRPASGPICNGSHIHPERKRQHDPPARIQVPKSR